ncbi:MAG: heparan-alpha-glucosaminide N-acetyltransferase domain-containing protein [Bacteroidia bacterium]|nr:heparan-alpha-glucosaminide N-acetyltransferase domain-containing protein [Bacteroidia bacterium]
MSNPLSKRLISLDVFRGLTIAGMIVVNDAGSWQHIYPPLRHATWHGITPTDYVFPFFLFIVGVSIVLAYSRVLKDNPPIGKIAGKILIRSAIIFGLGLFLSLWPRFNFANIRIPGVLQRISLVFLACSFIFLKTNWKTQAWIAAALLVGYWVVMAFIPIPIDETISTALATGQVKARDGMIPIGAIRQVSESFIAGNFEPGTNMEAWVDRLLVPFRLYQHTWDPEGLLSTLPAIASGLTGMLAGALLTGKYKPDTKVIGLMVGGFLAMTLGNVWDWFFPINKNLWTSSYVMFTSGLASMTLGFFYWYIDVLEKDRYTYVFKVFGANAITAYVLHSGLNFLFKLEGFNINAAFMDGLIGVGLEPKFVSLLWALSYTAFIFIPVWILYRRKIFIKI